MTTPLAETSRAVLARLPASLVRDLHHRSDAAIRRAVEHVGGMQMGDVLAVAVFGVNGAAESQARAFLRQMGNSAVATGMQVPMRAPGRGLSLPLSAMPYPPVGPPGNWATGGAPPPPMQEQPAVRRTPYALYQETALTAGVDVTTTANSAPFVNGTGRAWFLTHVTLSQGEEPLIAAPNFLIQVTPNNPGKSWFKNPVPAISMLNYIPYGPVQNVPQYPYSRWALEGSYTLPANGSMTLEGTNPASVAVTLNVVFVGYKRDRTNTPRFLTGQLSLAAGAQGISFDPGPLTGDGDADLDITEVLFNTGTGNWGILNQTSPQILIRPNGVIGDTTNWTGAQPVSVVHLNNSTGGAGAFLRLLRPVYVPPGTTVSVQYTNQSADAVQANLAFVGYLENLAA